MQQSPIPPIAPYIFYNLMDEMSLGCTEIANSIFDPGAAPRPEFTIPARGTGTDRSFYLSMNFELRSSKRSLNFSLVLIPQGVPSVDYL